jgi:hypothetical protein
LNEFEELVRVVVLTIIGHAMSTKEAHCTSRLLELMVVTMVIEQIKINLKHN